MSTSQRVRECDGACKEHVGEVRRVRVVGMMRDWGEWWYCEAAIANDRDGGLTVTDASTGATDE